MEKNTNYLHETAENNKDKMRNKVEDFSRARGWIGELVDDLLKTDLIEYPQENIHFLIIR